jgi:ABC-type branched-subunit amino acid transport system ATPase component
MTEPHVSDVIRTEHIVKSFGAVRALRDVSMHLMKGEILGQLGDNGAGKSTLIKIMTGFIQPDEGRIFVNGKEVKLRSVTHARSLGIETVYQDLALVGRADRTGHARVPDRGNQSSVITSPHHLNAPRPVCHTLLKAPAALRVIRPIFSGRAGREKARTCGPSR